MLLLLLYRKTNGRLASQPAAMVKKVKPGTFVIQGARVESLREALEKRGWQEEEEKDSLNFGLKWTIKADKAEQHIIDGSVNSTQILNHFQHNWEMITKHRFSGNLRALPWSEGVDPDTVVPHTYYLKEAAQLREFLCEYFVRAARLILIAALRCPAWPPIHPGSARRIGVSAAVIRRFLGRLMYIHLCTGAPTQGPMSD